MDINQFTERRTGTLVPIPHATPDVSHAFVPNALPPAWEWPHALFPLLLRARVALATLDGVGRHLPNPEIVLRPIQQREAKLSSQLEGTFTDAAKQALFQAEPSYPTSEADPTNAYREVFNYGRALRLRFEGEGEIATLPISKRLFRALHGVLMDGVRGQSQQPGEFRKIQNQIGHPARFVPPPPEALETQLDEFEKYLNVDPPADGFDPLVRAFLAHYQFEAIHPFGDGNGRVGRLLLALTIAEGCQLSSQWLYMSAFFERRKKQYMDLLLAVSTEGAWEPWIQFCLEGVVEQAKDTQRRCENLLALHRDFHQRLKGISGASVRLATIVDSLFDSPVVKVARLCNVYHVTYPTARADMKKLDKLGIVKPLPGMGTITYYCDPIFQAIVDSSDASGG